MLSGCKNDGTVTVIYTDVPPPLTRMSYEETLPPETYSQYMETYSVTSVTESLGYFESLRAAAGISADTGITRPSADVGDSSAEEEADGESGSSRNTLMRDTAVSTRTGVTADSNAAAGTNAVTSPPAEAENEAEETVTCAPAREEEAEPSETTATTLSRPKADTVHSVSVSADTAPTAARTESGSSSSGASE